MSNVKSPAYCFVVVLVVFFPVTFAFGTFFTAFDSVFDSFETLDFLDVFFFAAFSVVFFTTDFFGILIIFEVFTRPSACDP